MELCFRFQFSNREIYNYYLDSDHIRKIIETQQLPHFNDIKGNKLFKACGATNLC